MEISNEHRRQIVRKLVHLCRNHHRLVEKNLQDTGIYRGQHQLLMYIAKHPNRSQIEIAEGLDLTPATVAVTIKKLVTAGYIKKQVDDRDNRFNKIELTEKAEAVIDESIRIFNAIDKCMLKDFSNDELDTLMDYMTRIQNNLDEME